VRDVRRLVLGLSGTLVTGVLSMAPAHATQSTLCVGKSVAETAACDPGWAADMKRMHWRMYAGHNCTNYVAWRLTRDGVPQPKYRLGNAGSWAKAAKKNGVLVNSVPAVGAVGAWSGRGHVVYVEQVGPDSLVISEDSWSKKRYRRYIAYKGDRDYPTKFIHFQGLNGVTAGVPAVTGTPLVGQVLSVNPGVWGPAGVQLTYGWLRNGAVIPGAVGATYALTREDAGQKITATVTGTFAGKQPRTTWSIPTAPVSAGTIVPGVPQIQGDAVEGATLTAVPGVWSPADVPLTYQWFSNGKPIKKATATTYRPDKKQRGKTITVRVTGSGPGFQPVPAVSAPTAQIAKKGTVVGTVVPAVPVITGAVTMTVGEVLTVVPGNWAPAPVVTAVQWLRNGVPIPGATGLTYALTEEDIGSRLRVDVVGSRPGYNSAQASSPESAPVNPPQLG
jgi:surface antigen